jgi:hypothetical protein
MKWRLHHFFCLLIVLYLSACSDDDAVEKRVNQIGKWKGLREYISTDSNGVVTTKTLNIWFELREDSTGTINFFKPFSDGINDREIDLWVMKENQKRIELTVSSPLGSSSYFYGFRIDWDTDTSQKWTADTPDSTKWISKWRVGKTH